MNLGKLLGLWPSGCVLLVTDGFVTRLEQWTVLDWLLSLLYTNAKMNDVYLVSPSESFVLVAKAGCKAEGVYVTNPTESFGP